MTEKFQSLEKYVRKSSNHWKFLLCLFPIIGSLAMAQGPGGQRAFFQALFWGQLDPYERLLPTAYWYPSRDLNNTDRILGIASTNTVNAASVTINGWEFNGTSQYLDMGRPLEIEINTNLQYSMAVWVRSPTANDATRGIMGKTFLFGGDRWGLFANAANGHRAVLDENGNVVAISPTTGYASNTWYHLAMTIDRSQPNKFFLYRDGILEATGSFTDTDPITYAGNADLPFRFGSFNDSGGALANYWNGYIDQAAVWNGRALTPNEVFNLFEQTRSGRK